MTDADRPTQVKSIPELTSHDLENCSSTDGCINMMFAYRKCWLMSAVLALFSGTINAQVLTPVGNDATLERRREVGETVIKHLREGNVELAFKSLEAVADGPQTLAAVDDDGLSNACAGIHRSLTQLSSEAQFDMLSKWSMPADSPARIRVLTALVPTVAPPSEFARALGERPRKSAFLISSIGEVRGVFSTAWSLVVAARDSGRLKRLMSDLIPLVDQKIVNADLLMSLAEIADGRGDMSELAEQLSRRITQLKTASPQPGAGGKTITPVKIDPVNILLASAALQQPVLRSSGAEMFSAILASANGQPAVRLRPFLREAHAAAILPYNENHDDASSLSKWAQRLKYWMPVNGNSNGAQTLAECVWLTNEEQVLQLSGTGYDLLLCRYPLQGEFQFECETQLGGQTETDGGLFYSGLGFQVAGSHGEFTATDLSGAVVSKRDCPFVRPLSPPTFNRLSIRSTSSSAMMAVNLHPMWTESAGLQAGPWLGLRSSCGSAPLFRNLKVTGKPVIPRTVRLADGSTLRGWQSQVFGEQIYPETVINSEWRLAEGTVSANKGDPESSSNNRQHLLSYQRPLLAGEAISYEFVHQPGLVEVSPALGRMVFLVQPDGIRIHWVTDFNQGWTGLTADNAVSEPLNRRGPRALPLKPGEWNRVTMTRTESDLKLSLNGVAVYQRPVDWIGDHRFGLYRQHGAIGVQVRDIVLTGDWPESLPQDFLDHPTATVGEPLAEPARRSLNRLFQERFLAENVFAIRRRAHSMPVAERFEFLSDWVLPGPDHPGFRVTGDFTQTSPVPSMREPGVSDSELGGQIVSPVFDWLDAAKELGQLAECRQRVEKVANPANEFQQRARTALLLLLILEQGDQPAATAYCDALRGLLKSQVPIGVEDQWPETLVVVRGAQKFANHDDISELISWFYSQRVMTARPAGNNLWQTHIAAQFGRLSQQKAVRHETTRDPPANLKDWISVTAAKSDSRGQGYPVPVWNRHDHSVAKYSGHVEDYLFYRQPLSGHFEVECDLVYPTQTSTQIMIGGTGLGLHPDRKQLVMGSFRSSLPPIPIEGVLTDRGPWMHYRGVIRDGVRTIFLNGRQVRSEALSSQFDPWIAICSRGKFPCHIKDFRITGNPVVLDAVALSASKDLTGWIEYHDESITGDEGRWTYVDDSDTSGWIVGRSNPNWAGMFAESLLRYQRPLVEDGSIEYEFFYEPGKFETHPALDRLALILHPSGVREHWVTDGRHDRTELASDNSRDERQNRRGPAELPLMVHQWNRLKLTLHGKTARLELNGQQVYERELEAANQRTFGLFHYADLTEARVRNVVLRGDWPKTLPPVSDQELADKTTESLAADSKRLKAVFVHNFATGGVPDKFFQYHKEHPNKKSVTIEPGPEGLQVHQVDTTAWTHTDVRPRFTLSGDFDIEARFADLYLESTKNDTAIQLIVSLSDLSNRIYGHSRVLDPRGANLSIPGYSVTLPDGKRPWLSLDPIPCDGVSGRLRFSRRGQKMFYLFSEGDSSNYRVFATMATVEAVTHFNEIALRAQCTAAGTCKVCWKDVVLRAERMDWYPEPPPAPLEALHVMGADGQGLRTVATAAKNGFTTVGAPAWSSDGRKIALEMSNGSTATSHVIVINADGGELKDLGPGCSPSFSPDGSQLVCSQSRTGIVTMNSDGSNRQVIDAAGWGSQWSPDGKWIAYGKASNITLLDVKTRKSRPLLVKDAATRYAYTHRGLGWSHDSRSIAFKARRQDIIQDELAVMELDAADDFKILHPDASAISPDCTFTPDNQQVIVSIENKDVPGLQLHAISRKQPDQIQLLPGQPSGDRVTGCAWSHDGKSIVFASQRPRQSVDWITKPVSDPSSPK